MPEPIIPQVIELGGDRPRKDQGVVLSPILISVAIFTMFMVIQAGSKLGQILSELKSIAEEVKALRQAVQGLELGAKVMS
jgi:hypothetical protein